MPKEPYPKDLREVYLKNWILHLSRPDVLASISQADSSILAEPETALAPLRAEAAIIWQESNGVTLTRLADLFNMARTAPGCTLAIINAIEHFFHFKKAAAPRRVRHQEKRKIAGALGFFDQPYYLRDLLSGERTGDTVPNFTLREKTRNHSHGVPQRHVLSEVVDESAVVTNADTGYDVIDLDESIIYFSRGDDGEATIELAVLRDVARHTQLGDELYKWVYEVIIEACNNRTGIRPGDEGTMVQLGLNMGARHLRAIGLASSFKKLTRITQDTRISNDEDAVGAISLAWGIMEKIMPQEVIDISHNQLAKFMLPELVTPNKPPGGGYTVKLGGKDVTFPEAKRAPPEGYLSNGYEARTHIDDVYSPYAFTLNVDRRIVPQEETPEPSYQTRSATKKERDGPKPVVQGPANGGSSFVDISLGVVVRQGPGTMMAIRPEFIHGTSKGYGAKNSGVTVSFSDRIIEAWQIAVKGGATVKEFLNTDGQ